MYSDQFQAKIDALIAEYPELTESQLMEAAQNVDSFGYPYEEESDRVLTLMQLVWEELPNSITAVNTNAPFGGIFEEY
jgi:hypothetical protein